MQVRQFIAAWVLCCLLIGVGPVMAVGALTDLNSVRQAAGLGLLEPSAELNQAARAHAEYLVRYLPQGSVASLSAHEQHRSLPGFTGELAADRAAHFNYPHSLVTENISIGNKSTAESISSLMSAIYHRFAFLDPKIDQLGFAEMDRRYVFNMGRRELAQACLQQVPGTSPMPPHNCLGKRMRAQAFEQTCQQLPAEALYSSPYPNRCPNGTLLNRQFMQQVCEQPPAGAVLKGAGRYFDICSNGLKISGTWLDRICHSTDPNIIYPNSGSYYQICTPAQQVHARWYENFCDSLPADQLETDSGRYYRVCTNGFELKSEYLEDLQAQTLEDVPEAVLWPAQGVAEIQPVFYDEDPHPTPDLEMTGYPVSIQFNEQRVDKVSIMGFILEEFEEADSGGWKTVDAVRMIDHLSDINAKLTEHQFAWFPLQRLNWGTRYRYRVDALVDGVFRQYNAAFQTTQLPVPVYSVNPETGQVTVAENRFILYRAPDAYDAKPFQQVGLSYRGRPYVDVSVIDTNTVELTVAGSGCEPVFLSTRLEEQVQINFCGKKRKRGLF